MLDILTDKAVDVAPRKTTTKGSGGAEIIPIGTPIKGERTTTVRRLRPGTASARGVTAAARAQRALELRGAGATYQAIGEALGITKQAAHEAVKKAMAEVAEIVKSEAETVREMELARLDRMQVGLWTRATEGDARAVETVLKIMERRGRLLGLELPQPMTGTEGASLEVAVRYVENWRTD